MVCPPPRWWPPLTRIPRQTIRDGCNGGPLRFYSSDDVIGVEYAGALKNVVAIAAGVCDGIGAGDNGKAAVITRGIAEIARLGIRPGREELTFAGLPAWAIVWSPA